MQSLAMATARKDEQFATVKRLVDRLYAENPKAERLLSKQARAKYGVKSMGL